MNKLAVILGIMVLSIGFAIPAYAMGGGMGGGGGGGMGGGMMDNFGSGLLDWFQKWRTGSDYTHPPIDQRNEMEELEQRHSEDSAYLKYQITMKQKQLDAILNSSDPDIEKARAVNRDIRKLRAEADQEQRTYEFEADKMSQGYRSGNGSRWNPYGPSVGSGSRGMGYGGQMGDHSSGR